MHRNTRIGTELGSTVEKEALTRKMFPFGPDFVPANAESGTSRLFSHVVSRDGSIVGVRGINVESIRDSLHFEKKTRRRVDRVFLEE